MRPQARLTERASQTLARATAAGHGVAWGRGSDGRTAFYWARVTPARTSKVRIVRASDVDTLMEKVAQVAAADPAAHLIAGFSDPLRYCPVCNTETAFDADAEVVFVCAADSGHLSVRAI